MPESNSEGITGRGRVDSENRQKPCPVRLDCENIIQRSEGNHEKYFLNWGMTLDFFSKTGLART